MAQPAERPWAIDAFFAWQERQQDRYEFVGGFPVRMMAEAENSHDDIAVNIIVALGTRPRGGLCRPFTSDGAVETYPGRIRRPDAGIDCGRRDPNAYKAAEPRMVAEVLSPSTRDYDTLEKLAEYKSVESINMILFVEGLDALIAMPELGIVLPLAELYDGMTFPASPAMRAI